VHKLVRLVRHVYVAEPIKQYAVALTAATRTSPELRLGASPRATLHLVRAAKAWASLDGREYVLPDDLQALAVPVLAHRILPTAEAQIGRRGAAEVVADLVQQVPQPEPSQGR
jgi:MoxR-like ATPase